jgi:hypothetical protein
MFNTVVGYEQVIATILNTMRQLQESSEANDPGLRGVALK